MRNPHLAPHMKEPGAIVRRLLMAAQDALPELTGIGHDILTGRVAKPFPAEVVDRLRAQVAEAWEQHYVLGNEQHGQAHRSNQAS